MANDDGDLVVYLDGLVDHLRKQVPAALKDFDEKSIHQARVATRRIKAALDLLRPTLSDEHRKPFSKSAKKLRRRLGPLRDLDVMIGHLETIAARANHREAAQWLANRLVATREQVRVSSAKSKSPGRVLAQLGTWWGLREEVQEGCGAAAELLNKSVHLQLDRFAAEADQLVGRLAGGEREEGERQDPHQLRIAGKALRYTLEMAAEEGHELPRSVAKIFKRMQEALGAWHDYVVLTERALGESMAAMLAHHDAALQRKVLELSRFTLTEAQKQLESFAKIWKAEGRALSDAIRAAFVLGDAKVGISEPRKDRDLSGSGGSTDLEGAPSGGPEAA